MSCIQIKKFLVKSIMLFFAMRPAFIEYANYLLILLTNLFHNVWLIFLVLQNLVLPVI